MATPLGENPGGTAANTAAQIAAHGHPTRLFARLGRDENARRFRAACEDFDALNTEWLPATADIGTCLVLIASDGERTMITVKQPTLRGVRVPGEFTSERDHLIGSSDLVWVAVADPARRGAYWERALGTLRGIPASHVHEEFVAGRTWDICVGSLDDEDLPAGEALDAIGCLLAVMTDGADGSMVRLRGGDWTRHPAEKISREQFVDTTGAGDAFLAGLLVSLSSHADTLGIVDQGPRIARDAVRVASTYGAEAVCTAGSWPAPPTMTR